jgi:hypothetical protein
MPKGLSEEVQMKLIVIALLLAILAGCAVVPVAPYYEPAPYPYYSAPAYGYGYYGYPSFGNYGGYGYGYRGYYGGRYRGGYYRGHGYHR